MSKKEALIGKITFKIQNFSKMTKEHRFSQIMKIGQHEWILGARFEEMSEGTKHLSITSYCNGFIKESTWMTQVKESLWIVKGSERYNAREKSRIYNETCQAGNFYKFITKSSIPQDCIINDTLTLEAEIEVEREICLSVSFGNPVDDQAKNYLQLMTKQDFQSYFNNEIFSDIVFLAGPKGNQVRIFGHRIIIAPSSPVFSALFNKDSDFEAKIIDGKFEIEVPDIHPTALLTLLRFIYKKEVIVDKDLVYETLYIAEKYNVKGFVESLAFLVTTESILGFLSFVLHVGQDHALSRRCQWIMRTQIKLIIDTDSFVEVDKNMIALILSYPCFEMRELDLFHAYVKWADYQLEKQSIPINDENRRQVMKHINLIRFPIMTPEEFATGPAETGILTNDEKVNVFLHFLAKKPTMFSTQLRI